MPIDLLTNPDFVDGGWLREQMLGVKLANALVCYTGITAYHSVTKTDDYICFKNHDYIESEKQAWKIRGLHFNHV